MSYAIHIIDNGGVASPQGFRAAGIAAGIKASGNPDLGMVASSSRCAAAGVFTTNRLKGASLLTTHESIADGYAQAIVVNSGNANACTGQQGLNDARAIAERAGRALGLDPRDVLPNSTGVIGVALPMDKLNAGIDALAPMLSADEGPAFARAMMTTDTVPKFSARKVEIDGRSFVIGGAAKGAGMIHPNMATMLSFITTDAAMTPDQAKAFLKPVCDATYNRFTIDGDTSCDDTVLLLANGASGVEIDPNGASGAAFAEALHDLCRDLVFRMARDGEGVTKTVLIRVEGARTRGDATKIARSIAISPLVKTALHGCDPNWGRLINAAGYSGGEFDPERVDLYIGDVQIAQGGRWHPERDRDAHQVMLKPEYEIRLALNQGDAADWYLTTDFSKDYVDINADYRNRT